MNNFSYKIHSFVTERRRQSSNTNNPVPRVQSSAENIPNVSKEYVRMPRISLPDPAELSASLQRSFALRRSQHEVLQEPLPQVTLSSILRSLSATPAGSRPYPSGGAKYPIESYLLVQRAEGIERGAYHYHPHTHSLEHLWGIPTQLNLFSDMNAWAEDARAVIIFTANWRRNAAKYGDFGYMLGMLETGHAAQNILLAAAALEIPACPLAGFNDEIVTNILDLDPAAEQPIYTVALG